MSIGEFVFILLWRAMLAAIVGGASAALWATPFWPVFGLAFVGIWVLLYLFAAIAR